MCHFGTFHGQYFQRLSGRRERSVMTLTDELITGEQVAFLDRLALDIRGKTGWKARRTEIIRALVVALMASGVDLSVAASEEELAEDIKARLSPE